MRSGVTAVLLLDACVWRVLAAARAIVTSVALSQVRFGIGLATRYLWHSAANTESTMAQRSHSGESPQQEKPPQPREGDGSGEGGRNPSIEQQERDIPPEAQEDPVDNAIQRGDEAGEKRDPTRGHGRGKQDQSVF